MSEIIVKKLDKEGHIGDWHDNTVKWGVFGPGEERRSFFTKRNAMLYARIRRRSATDIEAGKIYAYSSS